MSPITKKHKPSENKRSSLLLPSGDATMVIIAEILSYVIATTQDLAELRTVSKRWNDFVLPYVLKSTSFLKHCLPAPSSSKKNNEDFILNMLYFGDDNSTAGKFCKGLSDPTFDFWLRKDIFVESMLFVSENQVDADDAINISKDEIFTANLDRFSNFCTTLHDTQSWEEFQEVAKKAISDGMFLSIEDLEKSKSTDEKINLQERDWEDGFHPVILKVKLPKEGTEILQHDGGCSHAILVKTRMSKTEYKDKRWVDVEEEETFVGYIVEEGTDGMLTCHLPIAIPNEFTWKLWYESTRLLPLDCVWRQFQERNVREGVAIADGIVPHGLHEKLLAQIDAFAGTQILDYHPNSNNMVRDIVHPALYSYVKGESELTHSVNDIPPAVFSNEEGGDEGSLEASSELAQVDYWGRKYEASVKYQWLPTYFQVHQDGSCTICDYINNLVPRSQYEGLYTSIAQLFSQALPLLESVYGYCRVVKNHHLRVDHDRQVEWTDKEPGPIQEAPVSLRGQRLQVVTKIVDYELAPGETYEGVWHVEGMSHEEIVATAIYFIDRDDDIVGGNILFKRAFHKQEASWIFSIAPQDRPQELDALIAEGLMPLGQVETIKGRLVVFPNSHVHKVTKLENIAAKAKDGPAAETTKQKRRIIVFFLINPERRIVSTREVPIQQEHCGGSMERADALKHRLELMKERKYTKQDWNVRDIELCEH